MNAVSTTTKNSTATLSLPDLGKELPVNALMLRGIFVGPPT
jgi:hypothetical protein